MKFQPTALCAAIYLSVSPCYADNLKQDMRDFFDDLNSSANLTSPQAAKAQSAGVFSLGALTVRSPVRNQQLASLRLPNFEAGCSGIDMFTGSFSYINSDQLAALGQAIASNALNFTFQLAIETISPMTAEVISDLRDLAQKVNSMTINSCEQGGSIGGQYEHMARNSSREVGGV